MSLCKFCNDAATTRLLTGPVASNHCKEVHVLVKFTWHNESIIAFGKSWL